MANVKLLSDESLRREGFSEEEIAQAKGRADAYVGEKNGMKYYRAQNELNIESQGEGSGSTYNLPDQMGEGNNRFGRPRFQE